MTTSMLSGFNGISSEFSEKYISNTQMNIVSFFAGAGGLDLGFRKAGFDVVWANEYDREIWETYEKNHKDTILDQRSISNITSEEIPDCDGIIGGPPCQSWSEAGALRGINDQRGQLFFEFIRILKDKQPLFFLAENVSGMAHRRNDAARKNIMQHFKDAGYDLFVKLLNASDYGVPQDRRRIFYIGFRHDLKIKFEFPEPFTEKSNLIDAIGNLADTVIKAKPNNHTNADNCKVPNHEYMNGGFSSIFMSRNRVRNWDEVSYTIQAGGRHAPLHPQAPKMVKIEADKREFAKGSEHLYRRLSVRECARIQTFPDDFIFYYKNVSSGYKMIGNAVPVKLAEVLANHILKYLAPHKDKSKKTSATTSRA